MRMFDNSDYSMMARVNPLKKTKYDKCSFSWTKSNMKDVVLASITVAPFSPEERTAFANTSKDERDPYHMDSGATSHCSPHCSNFIELTPIKPQAIRGVNGLSIAAIGVGKIKLSMGKGWRLTLKEVLFAPRAALRLISVGQLADDNMTTIFEKFKCIVHEGTGKILAEGTRKERGLYTLTGRQPKTEHSYIARAVPSLVTWHKRLGHVSYQSIVNMAKLGMTKGMPADLSTALPVFEHCNLGKQAKTQVPHIWEGERAKASLDIIYSDLTGPEDMATAGGAIYLMNIVDDYSSFPWGFTLKKKSDAEVVFQDWRTRTK